METLSWNVSWKKIVLAPGDLFKSYFMEKSRLQVHSLFCPKDNIKKKMVFYLQSVIEFYDSLTVLMQIKVHIFSQSLHWNMLF